MAAFFTSNLDSINCSCLSSDWDAICGGSLKAVVAIVLNCILPRRPAVLVIEFMFLRKKNALAISPFPPPTSSSNLFCRYLSIRFCWLLAVVKLRNSRFSKFTKFANSANRGSFNLLANEFRSLVSLLRTALIFPPLLISDPRSKAVKSI